MTLQTLRKELKQLFQLHSIPSPEADSGLLLMDTLSLSKTQLLTQNFEVPSSALGKIQELAKRRCKGEPIQYLLGHCPFMDLDFMVNPATLIPRQDTEILVEAVSAYLTEKAFPSPTLWDIGCGSGCIGISLAHLHPNLSVVELDLSQEALDTAAQTAARYNLSQQITFMRHDILSGMPQLPTPDLIVSNPPYIPKKDLSSLQREVRDFEPLSALDGGEDGLDFYRFITRHAPLQKGGLLAFEIGYDQGESVPTLLRDTGYTNIQMMRDLSHLPRVVLGFHP